MIIKKVGQGMRNNLKKIILLLVTVLLYAQNNTGQCLSDTHVSLYSGDFPNIQGQIKKRPRAKALTAVQMQIAKTAWNYFKNNYQEATGLVNSVNGYPSTTMWDTASYIGALVSAHVLGIIQKKEFDTKLIKLIDTFKSLKLFRGILPNKAYNTITKELVNYENKPKEIGFSALDIGRILIWFKILKNMYPEHTNAINQIVEKWDFSHILDANGDMYGAFINDKNETIYVQEGRFEYEQYAAKGLQLWGLNVKKALEANVDYSVIYDVPIPYDERDPSISKAHNYVTSESYLLEGIEFNWRNINNGKLGDIDSWKQSISANIFEVQKRRYFKTGILTARSEHHLEKAPYFVYDTIYSDGDQWNVMTDKGNLYPDMAAFAAKIAFGFWALFDDAYSNELLNKALTFINHENGIYEGNYEKFGTINTYTCNTNGIILETFCFLINGPFLT